MAVDTKNSLKTVVLKNVFKLGMNKLLKWRELVSVFFFYLVKLALIKKNKTSESIKCLNSFSHLNVSIFWIPIESNIFESFLFHCVYCID